MKYLVSPKDPMCVCVCVSSVLQPDACLHPNYLLQPVIGSTAPFRGWLRVIRTATGHVTIRTRDMRTARMGTRMIPKRTHCMETDTHTSIVHCRYHLRVD